MGHGQRNPHFTVVMNQEQPIHSLEWDSFLQLTKVIQSQEKKTPKNNNNNNPMAMHAKQMGISHSQILLPDPLFRDGPFELSYEY